MICPLCHSRDITTYYTAPPQYACKGCGADLKDKHAKAAFEVIGGNEARRKRPAMYGLPVCHCCSHAPHDTFCEFCEPKPSSVVLVPRR